MRTAIILLNLWGEIQQTGQLDPKAASSGRQALEIADASVMLLIKLSYKTWVRSYCKSVNNGM